MASSTAARSRSRCGPPAGSRWSCCSPAPVSASIQSTAARTSRPSPTPAIRWSSSRSWREHELLIALDAMGGDHAPAEIVAGALLARNELGIEIALVGEREVLAAELARPGDTPAPIE